METNTNTRLKDPGEIKDEEVPKLQQKRKIVAPQALFAPKKPKVVKVAPSVKKPIIMSVVPRKMKTITTRANPAIFGKE